MSWKQILNHTLHRDESYLEEIEGKVGKTFYMLVVCYRHPNINNYLNNKSDLNPI